MPPIVKKLIAVLVILVVANAAFVLYGQASFDATFQSLAKAFAENNATEPKAGALPSPVESYIERSGLANHPYKTLVTECDGEFFKAPGKRGMPMRALTLLRPTPDMLRAEKLEANALVTFNALESYHASRAKLQAMLFGIIPTGEFRSEAFARSELTRVLAYGLFNPALLACGCIAYETAPDGALVATIRDGNLTATARFELDAKGEIAAVSAKRLRPVKKELVPTSWRLEVLAWGERDGLRLPVKVKEVWGEGDEAFVGALYEVTSAKRL
ncbi:DUF6544 family protein [Hydrogenimonas sp.]